MAGASMKTIKSRIHSMESTGKITKAMEMVASSKLRRAQERAMHTRPYFEVLRETALRIAAGSSGFSSPYLKKRPCKKACYVVIAGDRGLAGGYNSNVFHLAQRLLEQGPACVLPVGRKAVEYFRAHGAEVLSAAWGEVEEVTVSSCFTMARTLCDGFLAGEYDELHVIYTAFRSVLNQEPRAMQLLPLEQPEQAPGARTLTLCEPDPGTVFAAIVPEYLGGLIYAALCESAASEQGARRTAMDAATKNAEEMIEALNLQYNRIRQGAITQEITEIVAGSES